jgi:hypothetical protein
VRIEEKAGPVAQRGEVSGRLTRSVGNRVSLVLFVALVLSALMVLPAVAQDTGTDPGQDTGSNSTACPRNGAQVPRAEVFDADCLRDLTTAGTRQTGHTEEDDWNGLNASGTNNPSGVGGLQVDGYFPDSSRTNVNNGWTHDSQFVLRFPNRWNGKLVVTGAPGVRAQYANDFIISDYVLSKGYAFASTDKGNTGVNFYDDGSAPGGSVAEWHRRVEQLTRAAKAAARTNYGRAPSRTYITGISNGGYLTRYALENTPELYDGGVDWEGTLFRAAGPNLLTYLPTALTEYPKYAAATPGSPEQDAARQAIIQAGFAPGSEFLWRDYYMTYWDLTQRIYREEFDPEYDGALKAGVPFCQPGTPNCDADYDYASRPAEVKEAVRKVQLTGRIGKPMITLHGTLDTLLPIETDSDVYRGLIRDAGQASSQHRYYKIEAGDHVDSFYDDYPERLRPILPCHRTAFRILEAWIENGRQPPPSTFVPKPASGDVVNTCRIATP